MQVSHQRCRHNAEATGLEDRQQVQGRAPALDSLVSDYVAAHSLRIGFEKRSGKPPGNG